MNNGKGTEFRNYMHPGAAFGEEADKFIAAAGHYGNKSHQLVRHYAEDLGYEYLSANSKEEYLRHLDHFLSSQMTDRPMLFEVFTTNEDESEAIRMVCNLNISVTGMLKKVTKNVVVEQGKEFIKKMMEK